MSDSSRKDDHIRAKNMEIGCESDAKIKTNLIHDVFGYTVTGKGRFSNITRFEVALFSLDLGESVDLPRSISSRARRLIPGPETNGSRQPRPPQEHSTLPFGSTMIIPVSPEPSHE